ncbi:MAG: Omp28-related outer membrane protein [Chloroflexota bacterium]
MKSITRLAKLFALVSLTAVSAFAVPRNVVLEEFTNSSCGPCAAQNPTYQKFIFDRYSNVIPIMYHSSFPGVNDVMYQFDKPMNQTRTNYYAVDGVPSVRVNGEMQPSTNPQQVYAGSPMDTVAIWKKVATEIVAETPITIGVNATIDENYKMTITGNVSSTEALSGKYLRVVLVEGYHYYKLSGGTNGEEDFFFVARKMFPDASGTSVTVAANGSQEFNFTYDIPEELYHKTLYVVAFVQDDASKQILQAARSSAPLVQNAASAPKIFASVASTDTYRSIEKGEQESYEYQIKNETSENITVALKAITTTIPQGWTFNLEPDTLVIPAGATRGVSVAVTPPNKTASAEFSFTIEPVGRTDGYKASTMGTSFYMTAGTKYLSILGASRLSVLGANTMLNLNNYGSETSWMPAEFGAMQAFPAQNFDVIVLPMDLNSFLAPVYTTPEAATYFLNWLKAGMDAGTHVWLSGDLAVNLPYLDQFKNTEVQNFFKDYFGVSQGAFYNLVQSGQLYTLDVKGNPNDETTKGMTIKVNGDYNQSSWPYYEQYAEYVNITNANIATPIFYGPGQSGDVVMGVKVERTLSDNSKGRAVYTGFNPEILGNATRTTLYTAIMNWLVNGPASVIEVNGGSLNLTVGPNPAVENANVRLELNGTASARAEVYVIDMAGKRVAELHNGAISEGVNEFNLNSARLANGSYFAIVNVDGKTLATPFNVVK